MVDIATQATSWPSPTQYIQTAIDAESAGTTFRLLSGVHRMQSIALRANDTLELVSGAILRGSQDISGLTWTPSGTEWWASISDITDIGSSFTYRSGYAEWRQWPIIDGDPKPFVTTQAAVDSTTCYYDSAANRLYIGVNPSGKTVELARTSDAIKAKVSAATGVTIFGDRANPGIIENYASYESTSGAGLDIGRYGSSAITNANWIFRDLEVRNFRGMAISHADDCLIQRITLHHTGQLGMGGAWSEDVIVESCCLYINGICGLSSGGEAGNTKWTHLRRGEIKGNYFDTVDPNNTYKHPHLVAIGPCWFDVSNDGTDVFRNQLFDRARLTARGLFWEISYSAKIFYNWLYECGWNAENASWMVGMAMNTSGAIPGTTHYNTLEVSDNIFYKCAGGPKAAQEVSRGSGDLGLYLTDYLDVFGNIMQYRDDDVYERVTAQPQSGITGGTTVPWGYSFDWDYNLYIMDDATKGHFRADPDFEYLGGGFGTGDWVDWTTFGFDANGVQLDHDGSHPRRDFSPYRGGAL